MTPRCKWGFSPACRPEGPLYRWRRDWICHPCAINCLGYEGSKEICGDPEVSPLPQVTNGDELEIPTVIIRW
jgi:hypothetical protein